MNERGNTGSHRRESRIVIVCMLFGFALVCCANLICFFPQTLIHVSDEAYRDYNLFAALSIVAGSLLCALFSLSRVRRPEKGMLSLGYASLVAGLVCSYFVGDGSDATTVGLTAVACGFGVGLLMVCWFSFLRLIPERYAMFTQGGQALLGSLLFVAIVHMIPSHTLLAVLACLGISAVLAILICRHAAATEDAQAPRITLKEGLRIFARRGGVGGFFTVSLFAFIAISLLNGIITAVIMAPESDPHALGQATWGGIVGAGVFLLWAFFSKKRDYSLVLKVFFGVLAFVLILPIEGHGVVTAAGYQLVCLLFFSLVIDTFSSNRRVLLLVLSLSYALTRGLFLLGLYIPGKFGVGSYTDFFNTASLLFFLVYVVFIVLLFIFNRERSQPTQDASPSEQKISQESASSDADATTSPGRGTQKSRLHDADYQDLSQTDALRGAIGEDIVLASASLAQKNGLTKRETEVLAYLARGRDVAFICSELYLTRNTVKSYAKAIYAKLGVHSQQELIDAVDQEAAVLGRRTVR